MLNKIFQSLEKPLLYQKTEGEFWNDKHISKQMLKAHLDCNLRRTAATGAFASGHPAEPNGHLH